MYVILAWVKKKWIKLLVDADEISGQFYGIINL